jgi:hypothetical protein
VTASLVGPGQLTVPVYWESLWLPVLRVGEPQFATVSGRLRCIPATAAPSPALSISAIAGDSILAHVELRPAGDGAFELANLPQEARLDLVARSNGRLVGVRPLETAQKARIDDLVFYVRC